MKAAARAALAGLLAVWLALLALILLTACGGGAAAPAAVQTPAPVTAPVVGPASGVLPPAPGPAPSAPAAPQPAWVQLWSEAWQEPVIQGWARADARPCAPGSLDDPGSEPRRNGPGIGDWTSVGYGPRGSVIGDGRLVIDEVQTSGGWALLTGKTFPAGGRLAVEGSVDLQPDDGAWVGLTLHNGDGNYREVGVASFGGVLRGIVHAPCYLELLGAVPAGPRHLRLEYDPAAGWRMLIDRALVYSEPIGYRNNRLAADPVVGLFVVNLSAEAQRTQGRIRAVVGPIKVEGQ